MLLTDIVMPGDMIGSIQKQVCDVVVRDMDGTARVSGSVFGIDDEGRLLVAGLSGVEAVTAGEVTLREPGMQPQ